MSDAHTVAGFKSNRLLLRKLFLTLSICAGTLLLVPIGAQAADDFDPMRFDVQVEMGPGQDSAPQGECVNISQYQQRCKMDMNYSATDHDVNGTVKDLATSDSGTMSLHGDFVMQMEMSTLITMYPNFSQTFESLSGSGHMTFAWLMKFNDSQSSTLAGVIDGKMTQSLNQGSNPQTMHFKGDFKVEVTYGSGRFEGAVGSGSFAEENDEELGGEPSGEKPNSVSAAAADSGDGMNLKLKKGAPRARIVIPETKITGSDKYALRVATVPGASCKATASSGSKRVALGSAKAKNANASFKGQLSKKLSKRQWTVKTACSYTSGGKSGTAKDTERLTVA